MISLILWFSIGTFAVLSNNERVPRVFGRSTMPHIDVVQNIATFILGPIGLVLVLLCGGKFRFWK